MVSDGAPDIENLEILELLGQGGMSRVFKARQVDLDRIVAVKVLNKVADSNTMQRFKNEAKNTSLLDHPNIVRTLSFGLSKDQQPFLLMEYLEGKSLAEIIQQQGSLDYRRFRNIFLPVLSALQTAHEKEIVHRDIKPGNIMICKDASGNEQAKLVDFGISKTFITESQQNLTRSGAIIGSPTYMSPEQCQGQQLDNRSDLYSLSCVMYESLVGEPPFSGESLLEVMQKHVGGALPEPKDIRAKVDINKELLKTILWGLEKVPDSRPQSASKFAAKLANALERVTLDKLPSLKKEHKKSVTLAVVLTLLIGVIVLGLANSINTNNRSKQEQEVADETDSRKEKALRARLNTAIEKNQTEKIILTLTELASFYQRTRCYTLESKILEQLVSQKGKQNTVGNEDLIRLAEAYVNAGQFDSAVNTLTPNLSKLKSNAEILKAETIIASALVSTNKPEAAEFLSNLLHKEMKISPLSEIRLETDAIYATYLIKNEHYAQAEGLLESLIAKRKSAMENNGSSDNEEKLSDELYQLAELELKQKKTKEAIAQFKNCLLLSKHIQNNRMVLQNTVESLVQLESICKQEGNSELASDYASRRYKLLELSSNIKGKHNQISEYLLACNSDLQARCGGADIHDWRLRTREIDHLFSSSKLSKKHDVQKYIVAMMKFQLMQNKASIEEIRATLKECIKHSYAPTGEPTFETAFSLYHFGATEQGNLEKSLYSLKRADAILRDPNTKSLPLNSGFVMVKNIINIKTLRVMMGDVYSRSGDLNKAKECYMFAIEHSDKADLVCAVDATVKCSILLASEGQQDKAARQIGLLIEKIETNNRGRLTELVSLNIFGQLQKLVRAGLTKEALALAKAVMHDAETETPPLPDVISRMNMYIKAIEQMKASSKHQESSAL